MRVANLSSPLLSAAAKGEAVVEVIAGAGASAGLGADEASGLDTITAPIRNARGVLACGWEKVTFAAAGGDDAEAAGDKYEEVAATCREGAASRLDTSAAPTRHVRVTNLSSPLLSAAARG